MKVNSLSYRLLISASFIFTVFFALVAFVLEQGFRESAEQVLKEKLQIHLYSLLSVGELTDDGELKMPNTLREPRFSNPSSGLYAAIYQAGSTIKWRSASAVGIDLSYSREPKPGEFEFIKDNQEYFVLSYAVIWENLAGPDRYYIFTVAEDKSFVTNQVEQFRVTSRSWLLFIGLLLIFIQFLVLRWSLTPLRTIVYDLEQIEAGGKKHLDGQYPVELKGLAGNLNALINSERAHLERYRNTLADLAHSLKTPLAILRGCFESGKVNKLAADEQITRMNEIVEYQLQKAAAKGQHKLTGKFDIALVIKKIIVSLNKVYPDKAIHFALVNDADFHMYCEEGDIYEIAGNLLDNAAKWCKQNIRISLIPLNKKKGRAFSLLLQIEDDGPGIPKEKIADILLRGVRVDENMQGHGIGMAVVNELIELLGGKLTGDKSKRLGGMKWQVYLP